MRLQRIIAVIAAGCLLLLTGCWDSVELNRRAIVAGVAIDKGPSPEKKYMLSFQVIVADETTGKNSRGNSPVVLYTGTGRSMYEALSSASRQVARFLSLGHIRVIIISEEFAREGIKGIMDTLERESEARLTSLMFVSRGQSAKECMSLMTALGRIPANDLVGKVENTSSTFGYNFRMEVDDIIRGIQVPGGGALMNGVLVSGDKEKGKSNENMKKITPSAILRISGIAAFKGDKLVGWLDNGAAKGLALIQHRLTQSPTVIRKGDEVIVFNVFQNKLNLKTIAADPEHPAFIIRVTQQASIKELNGKIDLTNPIALRKAEAQLEESTKSDIMEAVKMARSMHSDYLGFGEAVERTNPRGWRKVKDHWDDAFARCKVEVEVKAVTQSTEMRSRSMQMPE
ncbi:Ger(x)C family spore germination protein [Paenibacillus durus]|uniref:Ger(x)C family spore germination protein n=1 Tax=Paenibacillus durus TaxID=44251 RepID=UPI0004BC7D8B|nr:Ger(x)C family spore germination protein [Paenibacillus durus]